MVNDLCRQRTASAPISGADRIEVIDILRGIAVFGILASDMIGLSSPDHHFNPSFLWNDTISNAIAFLLDVFVSEKFITIFSVLFGVGFAIQMDRARKGWADFLPRYLRRLAVLLLMGLIHGLFFWPGDILSTYAIIGLLLLIFVNRKQKTLLCWTIGLQCLLLLFAALMAFLPGRSAAADQTLRAKAMIELFGNGSWAAIQSARITEFYNRHMDIFTVLIPFILPRFLFGLWLWRSGFVQNLSERKPLLRRICISGISIGIAGETITALLHQGDFGPLRVVSIPLLAAGYASGIALFHFSGSLPRLQRAIVATGRSALSNYLFQRVLCTMIFFSYGFALYGKVKPLGGFAIVILIYLFELLGSAWWMTRFQFGPMEWIWRSLTYWRLQPLKAEKKG